MSLCYVCNILAASHIAQLVGRTDKLNEQWHCTWINVNPATAMSTIPTKTSLHDIKELRYRSEKFNPVYSSATTTTYARSAMTNISAIANLLSDLLELNAGSQLMSIAILFNRDSSKSYLSTIATSIFCCEKQQTLFPIE
jgi:hypothetical protein